MRIISGRYGGLKLNTISGNETRPTADRVKESLFNILQGYIADATVLDLFAGSGALGIECLSRGAKFVTFCDINRACCDVIYKNLKNIDAKYNVVNAHFERVLKSNIKYDIIFIDAPYKSDLGINALKNIVSNQTLDSQGIIVYERLSRLSYELPQGLVLKDSRKYGETTLDFIRYENLRNDG